MQSLKDPGRLFSLERKVLESPCSRPTPTQLWKVRENTEKLPEGCMARPGSSAHAGRNTAPPVGDKPPSLHPAQSPDSGVLTVWMRQSLGVSLQWTRGQDDHNETVLQQGRGGRCPAVRGPPGWGCVLFPPCAFSWGPRPPEPHLRWVWRRSQERTGAHLKAWPWGLQITVS